MISKQFLHLVTTAFLVVVTLGVKSVGAQTSFRANIDYIIDQQFPLVEAYVSLSDAQSQPIRGITADQIIISEDSHSIKPLEISEIENTQQPLAIVLVMDTSGSMGSVNTPSPLNKAVDAAKAFTDQLTPQDQVGVIKFSDSPSIVQPLTTDKSAVKAALDGLKPEGSHTTLYDAIVDAVNMLRNFSGRKITVLVTDGKDTGTGAFNFDQAVHEASLLSIPIYPLGFGSGIDQDRLTRLAKLTGGITQFRPTASELQASFNTVLQNLRNQYLIRYISSFSADENQHTLLVTATYQGSQLEASRFFTARSSQIPVSLPDYEVDQVVGGIEIFKPTTDWPAPLKELDIAVDGVLLTSIADEPFEYQWDTTKTEKDIPVGLHEFKFTYTDIAGNTGQTRISLNVQPPLTVQVTQPGNGNTVSGSTPIKVEVTSLSDIQIGTVEIAVDGQIIGGSLMSPPYETQWDLSNVPAGKHTITVKGFDATGQFTDSDEIIVDVAVGTYSWMITLIVLVAIIAVMIPLATRKRKQMRRPNQPSIKAGQASLRETKGLNPNQVWPLGMNEVRLGRKRDENDIPLEGRNASRKHAAIRHEGGHYVIYSLSTDNPVVVNNVPIIQSRVLQPDDEIRLGDSIFMFGQDSP